MSKRKSIELENRIIAVFKEKDKFEWNKKIYDLKIVGKPRPQSIGGECKTDVYIRGSNDFDIIEFKISVKTKKTNEFQENKINQERAENIFGTNYNEKIIKLAKSLHNKFMKTPLIFAKKPKGNATENSITLGWKPEISTKERNLSIRLDFSEKEIREKIYKGINIEERKKHSIVNGQIIKNSGIAEYIIFSELEDINCIEDVLSNMELIDNMDIKPIYLIFTANNYRSEKEVDPKEPESNSTDGKRPICVWVDWKVLNGKLNRTINYSDLGVYTGYHFKPLLKEQLNKLNVIHPKEISPDQLRDPSVLFPSDWKPCKSSTLIKTTVSDKLESSFNRKEEQLMSKENGLKENKRGRGKFKPAPDYDPDQVRKLLLEKINEERETVIENENDFNINEIKNEPGKMNVLSLFSGAGGLDLGFELAGLESVIGEREALEAFTDRDKYNQIRDKSIFHSVYSNDIFQEALETYKINNGNHIYIHKKDIRKINEFPDANIVLGGFPCPGFSEAGPRLVDDERNFLYLHFIRCLMQVQPEIFVAENVKGMMTLGKGEVFKQIVEDFAAAGYTLYVKLLNSRDYGVPQIRERVLIVGVRNDIDFNYEFPEATHGPEEDLIPYNTLRDAIGDLIEDPGPYFKGSYSTIFMSRNRKKNWEDQSFTIQASGRQAPIHPGGLPMEKVGKDKWIFPDGEEKNRRLSIKEIKRIQTFPDWYDFSLGNSQRLKENSKLDKAYKQIGNAVPVMLARAVAKPIAEWAIEYTKSDQYENNQMSLPL
ncbi:DNA cytosine methyltransferase [Guptibacillus hwajinpoensis]|uniref:DNA cytosine methyltransferase n=1 Tax=Guptibacillus hwajinpoensis TaxID=208199 RepID=UPI001CFCA9F0|nr:DNA cytosine methyltransferase [Pseudalkalibacillus hwajinpoensis]WLR60172.1 DNA cytosine methyltransferase [Pseudalkalibacillus hwajinpoensis]